MRWLRLAKCRGGFDWLAAWVASIGSLHGWLRQALPPRRLVVEPVETTGVLIVEAKACKSGFDWLAAWVVLTGSATEETGG